MIFVGSGALLVRAINHVLNLGIKIEGIYCPIGDSSVQRLKKLNLSFIETNDPNPTLLTALNDVERCKIFSINNKFILSDAVLELGHDFFNIHNGLIQVYRGIAEVCIFAAICRGEKKYGVTLHKLLPGQKVDSGPVVGQIEFDIEFECDFFKVMKKSLDACHKIFEEQITHISDESFELTYVEQTEKIYSYKDVLQILKSSDQIRRIRASNLGAYRPFFPKLVKLIEDAQYD